MVRLTVRDRELRETHNYFRGKMVGRQWMRPYNGRSLDGVQAMTCSRIYLNSHPQLNQKDRNVTADKKAEEKVIEMHSLITR